MGKNKKKNKKNKEQKTKKYKFNFLNRDKTKKTDTTKKEKKIKDKSKKKKHPIIKKIIITLLVLFILFCLIIGGILAGFFMGAFGDDFIIPEEDLLIKTANSYVYDIDGNLIQTLSGDEVREVVTIDEMPAHLPTAFVSIEDERFFQHSGVDIKRTLAAVVTFITNKGESSFGGSTITQQLVKNITKEDEDSAWAGVTRKVKEMARAYNLEKTMSKNQILELYLNIIYMGGSGAEQTFGMQVAAKYYFNKDVRDLDLAECAFLAGINHAPNMYNAFSDNEERKESIKTRTKIVLNKMHELGKIETEEEYNAAIAKVEAGLPFNKGTIKTTSYSYHTDAAINQVVTQLKEEKGWSSTKLAELELFSGGYSIYTTQKTSLQNFAEEEGKKDKYSITSRDGKDQKAQAGMAVIDQSNGYVVAVLGGLGEKPTRGFNWATQGKKQTGSSIKPLSVVAPGVEFGTLTVGTVYDDVRTTFSGGYTPKNYSWNYTGLMTIRAAVGVSQNIPFLKGLQDVGIENSWNFLNSVGLDLTEEDKGLAALALGGLTKGVSPLQMAAAYAAIANDGVYITPTFYTKVTDKDGNVVLEPKQESKRVLSEASSFVLKSVLREPVTAGSASYCAISGMDVGAKTGTSSDDYDRWLCGITPYYSAACWVGFKENATVYFGGQNPAGRIWDAVMTEAHKGLQGKRFARPANVVYATICKDSGMLAGEFCKADPRGNRAYSEVFVKGSAPSKVCDCHVKVKVCEEGGVIRVANEFCTANVKEQVFITRKDATTNQAWQKAKDAQYMLPEETCTIHVKPEDKTKPVIKLKGDPVITIVKNEKYEELGAIATDQIDGDLTSKIQLAGKVDNQKEGTYVLTYTVKDNAGNEASVKRTVKVVAKSGNTNTIEPGGNNTNTVPPANTVSSGNVISENTVNSVTPGNTTNTTKPKNDVV